MARRGSYPKGEAKREEILERALNVVAEHGYRGASVKEIADAVGLTQAGMLYHFGTKEQLFVDILRKRDEHDHTSDIDPTDPQTAWDAFIALVRHNAEVPGLIELFAHLAAAAADPAHPAHEFFELRGLELRAKIAASIQPLGARSRLPPELFATIVQATADGLQTQWLLDRSVDMAGTLQALIHALVSEEPLD